MTTGTHAPGSGDLTADEAAKYNAIWEQVARYEARFNRLLVYRGNTLHSAEVPPDLPLPADPRTGPGRVSPG